MDFAGPGEPWTQKLHGRYTIGNAVLTALDEWVKINGRQGERACLLTHAVEIS